MDEKKNEPIKSSRPCAGLELTVWANKAENGNVRYTTSIKKSWKENDVFRERKISLTPDQLAAVSLEAGRLFAWMAEHYPATNDTL